MKQFLILVLFTSIFACNNSHEVNYANLSKNQLYDTILKNVHNPDVQFVSRIVYNYVSKDTTNLENLFNDTIIVELYDLDSDGIISISLDKNSNYDSLIAKLLIIKHHLDIDTCKTCPYTIFNQIGLMQCLTYLYNFKDDFKLANIYADSLLKYYPDSLLFHNYKIGLLKSTNKNHLIKAYFDSLINVKKNKEKFFIFRAMFYKNSNNLELAVNDFIQSYIHNKDKSDGLDSIYGMFKNDTSKQIQAILRNKTIEEPQNPYNWIAYCYPYPNLLSLKILDTAITKIGNSPDLFFWRGLVKQNLRKGEEDIKSIIIDFETCYNFEKPKTRSIVRLFNLCYYSNYNKQKTIELANKILEIEPNNVDIIRKKLFANASLPNSALESQSLSKLVEIDTINAVWYHL